MGQPQNFKAKPYLSRRPPKAPALQPPSQHLRQSGGNTPHQGKADPLPCPSVNICERSTISRKADNTTFKLGRQIALVPWDIKKKKKNALKPGTSPPTLLPALFLCHNMPPHRLSGMRTPSFLQTRHRCGCLQGASETSSSCLHGMDSSGKTQAKCLAPKGEEQKSRKTHT